MYHLTQDDFNQFRTWLNLNLDGLTWQGRFKKEFEQFWDSFFVSDVTLDVMSDRFKYAHQEVRIGSLSSWFLWLRDKFIAYLFVQKNFSIEELHLQLKINLSVVSTILRNFLVEEFPYLEEELSGKFLVSNALSPNLKLTYNQLKNQLSIPEITVGTRDDDFMPSMEVTLFEDWTKFTRKMKNDFAKNQFDLKEASRKNYFMSLIKITQEVFVLLIVFSISFYALKKGNQWYEKSLMTKVSIYEPKFSSIAKNIFFKGNEVQVAADFKLNYNEIKDITKGEIPTEFFDPEKYEEETEVTLSSTESIPRDFSEADKESSEYEGDAENPNGLREVKDGKIKIYRLMMSSTNTYGSRDKIVKLAKKYAAEPVGESSPGQDVPGGVYFHLNVPRKELKNFLSETMLVDQAKLYESNASNIKLSPGKARVFIMVKSI